MKKIIYLIFLILSLSTDVKSQADNPLLVEIVVLPPYSTSAIDYFTSPVQTAITIINPTLNSYNVYFAGSITNLTTQQGATIRNDIVPPVPPLVIEPGVRIMTGSDLAPYVSAASLQYNGLSEQDAINGNLPEGEYQICLQLYGYSDLQLRSQPEPAGCSNVFTIQFIQPPFLIAPACSSEVNYLPVQNIVFSWVPPPLALIQNSLLSYEFRLVEVPQGMTPIHAMQSVTVPIAQTNTLFNTFVYTSVNPPLIPGRLYAWRVKISDLNNNVLFSNNGESEICEFRYGLPDPLLIPMTASIAYPAPGSKTPFQRVPIIAKYEPVDSAYRSLRVTTRLNDPEGNSDLIELQSTWPNGPDAFIQQQLGAPPSLAQLQHVQAGRNIFTFPGTAEIKHGKEYQINSTLDFELADGGEKTAQANGTFSRGLNKPVLKEPRLDTVYLNQNRIRFRFKTSDTTATPPGQYGILPPSEIIKSTKGNLPALFKAEVRERYRLEVSKSLTFDSILVFQSGVLEVDEQITPSTNVNFLKSRIYRELTTEIYLADTGTYFWRVHWLGNPLDTASAPYETSLTERFKIMGTPLADSVRSACVADCDAPPITDRTPVNTLQPGQKVKVGKFTMDVQTVTYNGPEASGLGLIPVSFMNTIIKVQFTNIKVNAANEMFSGNVAAREDTIGFMPNIPGLGKLTVNNREELVEYIKRGRQTSILDPSIPMGLPLGLDKVVDSERFVVAIVGMSFQPERATLSAAVSFPMPFLPPRSSDGKTQQLGLGASNLCFHPQGLAGLGIGGLFLFEPIEFDYAPGQYIKFHESNMDPITGMVADSGTYVSWDCEGFRALHVKGEISFSDELLTKPVVTYSSEAERLRNIRIGENNDVKARFKFNVKRSGNWLAMLDMDPFCVKGIDDWNFVVKEATLDFSDLENPPNLIFPENYSGDRSILWNGFHLKQVKLGLPQELRPRFPSNEGLDLAGEDSVLANRIIVDLTDLLIDRTGVSGKIASYNLLDLKDGDLNGWSFSLDTLSVEFVSNSFTRGGFNGKVLTPLTPTQFKYNTVLSQSSDSSGLRFGFNIQPLDTLTVPVWAATMNVLPTSRITIEADTGGFKPNLVLNGSIDIMQKIGEVDVRFAGVRFEQLKLQTIEPMLSCSSFTFSSPQKLMAGFPVSVSDIKLVSQDYHGLFSWDDTPGSRQALTFTVSVNFMGEDNSFGGSTTLAILGRFDMGDLLTGGEEYPSLKLTGIDLKTINIRGDLGFVTLEGFINFYAEDEVYGTGFVGGIDATFIKCINVSVIGCFGEVNDMRYWYVDAMAKFMPGINLSIPAVPPVPIPIDLYGFGGGAFYKMSLTSAPPSKDASLSNRTPDGTPTPGTTLSALRLVPNEDAFFGLMATVVLGSTGGGQAFNCDLTIAAEINNHGGINRIGLAGSGYFMSNVFDRDFSSVSADVALVMNFPEVQFDASYNLKINVPYLIEGNKDFDTKLAGNGHMHFDRNTWSIISGTPSNRNKIKLARVLELDNYLMVGMNLPPPPSPDQKFTSKGLSYEANRGNSISSGNGFAFGASLSTRYNESFGPFKARLDAGVGFDVSLLNMGSARCDGMSPGEQIGINGWYAQGSLWAHFDGAIYLETDVFGDVNILETRFAANVSGGFPNPDWAKGNVNLDYDILNGAYSGTCRFKFELGETCEPVPESPIAGLRLISELTPAANLTNVDCRTLPNAVFNVDIDKEIVFQGANSNGDLVNRRFKFVIDEYSLKKGSLNIATTQSIKDDGSQAMLLPNAMLSAHSDFTLTIRVKALERIGSEWRTAKRSDNTNITETVTQVFRTGALPNSITDNDVRYSYPLNRQRYFCKNQCSNGVINMKQDGWGYLFSGNPPAGYTRDYIAQFEPNGGGQKLETEVVYNAGKIVFDLPQELQISTLYRIRILYRDKANQLANANPNIGNQLQSSIQDQFQNSNVVFRQLYGDQVIQRERTGGDFNAIGQNEHLIYQYFFKTGKHNTLADKINAMQATDAYREDYDPYENLILRLQGAENLEEYEVSGYRYSIGHTQYNLRIMDITDSYNTTWHTSFVVPVIYNLYNRIVSNNYSGQRLIRPNPDYVGTPPNRIVASVSTDLPIRESEIDPSLRTASVPWIGSLLQIQTNAGLQVQSPISGTNLSPLVVSGVSLQNPNPAPNPNIMLIHETSEWAKKDYIRLKTIVANIKVSKPNLTGIDQTTRNMIATLDNGTYRNMTNGNYRVNFATYNPSGCNGGGGNNIFTSRSFNVITGSTIQPIILQPIINQPVTNQLNTIQLNQFITF